ncbi:MAG: MCE family protein, partial [Rhodococcus sp. (in: high G+C Gram-positive bacteria)]|uniref:MCE family protein n=1 Tax=Rhodococcus sp. TaxID=1831 RepID=UPI003BB0D8E0
MHLSKRTRIQLAVFVVVTLVAGAVMAFSYMRLPSTLFGIGRYTVTVELPVTGGLYQTANVTFQGVEVGKVEALKLTDAGVEATLSLTSGTDIPSDLDAQVHSRSAIGEQYVELIPRKGVSAPLEDGDVIPIERASVPPDIATLLDTTQRSLAAIPKEDLGTVVDEAYNALNGTGPELSRLLDGASSLTGQARENLGPLLTLIDQSVPVLQSQANTSDSIGQWSRHLADITNQLRNQDAHVRNVVAT